MVGGHAGPFVGDRSPEPTTHRPDGPGYAAPMKKLLLLVVLAGVGYLVYRQIMANKAEQDLWSEATAEPDLR